MSTSKWKWVSINSNNSGNSRSESGIISLPVEVKRRHVLAVSGVSSRMWRDLHQLIQEPICVAVGETGLDCTSDCECVKQGRTCHSTVQCKERNRANHEEAFLNHLQLAVRFDKPVVLHCRDHGDGTAAARVLQLIHQHNFKS
jgi:Tat protein secretion system quality control protein TatD with DNase activity